MANDEDQGNSVYLFSVHFLRFLKLQWIYTWNTHAKQEINIATGLW